MLMAAICRGTIIKEGTPFTSEWSLRSLRNSHAVYVGIYIPFISEWLRRSAGICKSRKKQSVSKSFSPCDKFYSNKFSSWRKFISFLSSQMRLFPIYCYLLDFLGVNRTHHKRKKETRAQTEQFAPLSEQHRRGPSPAFCVQTVKFPGIAVLFFTLEVRCTKIAHIRENTAKG